MKKLIFLFLFLPLLGYSQTTVKYKAVYVDTIKSNIDTVRFLSYSRFYRPSWFDSTVRFLPAVLFRSSTDTLATKAYARNYGGSQAGFLVINDTTVFRGVSNTYYLKYTDTTYLHAGKFGAVTDTNTVFRAAINKLNDSIGVHRTSLNQKMDSLFAHRALLNSYKDSIAAHRIFINLNRDTLTSHNTRINSAIQRSLDSILTHRTFINTNRDSIHRLTDSINAHNVRINARIPYTDTTSSIAMQWELDRKLWITDTTNKWAPKGIYIFPNDTAISRLYTTALLNAKLNTADSAIVTASDGILKTQSGHIAILKGDSSFFVTRYDTTAMLDGRFAKDTLSLSNRITSISSGAGSADSAFYVNKAGTQVISGTKYFTATNYFGALKPIPTTAPDMGALTGGRFGNGYFGTLQADTYIGAVKSLVTANDPGAVLENGLVNVGESGLYSGSDSPMIVYRSATTDVALGSSYETIFKSGNVYPTTTSSYDLGRYNFIWDSSYINYMKGTTLNLGGATLDSAFTTSSTQGAHIGRGLLVGGNASVGGTLGVTGTTTWGNGNGILNSSGNIFLEVGTRGLINEAGDLLLRSAVGSTTRFADGDGTSMMTLTTTSAVIAGTLATTGAINGNTTLASTQSPTWAGIKIGAGSYEQLFNITAPTSTQVALLLEQAGVVGWRIGTKSTDGHFRINNTSTDFSTTSAIDIDNASGNATTINASTLTLNGSLSMGTNAITSVGAVTSSGLSDFGTNGGNGTIGAGDSVQVTVTGLTSATGVAMVCYKRGITSSATADTIATYNITAADKLTLFGKYGYTVSYSIMKK